MNLIDALRLLPGDRIENAGDQQMTYDWSATYSGTVIRVTDKGGILIEDDRGFEHWLAYNHVREIEHVRRRPTGRKPLHDQREVRDIIRRVVIERGTGAAARVLRVFGRVERVQALLPQDYGPVYRACEDKLARNAVAEDVDGLM